MAADPHVFEVARLYDLDGRAVIVGVDYGAVTVAGLRLDTTRQETFAQALVRATWLAGQHAEQDRAALAADADLGAVDGAPGHG